MTFTPRLWGGGLAVALLSLSTVSNHAQSGVLATSRTFTHPRLGITVVATELDLPPGEWMATSIAPADAIEQVYLTARIAPDDLPGRRTLAAHVGAMTQMGQWRLQALWEPIAQYAAAHQGVGPRALTDLSRAQYGAMIDEVSRSPWPEDAGKPNAAPYLFLVPSTRVTHPAAPNALAAVVPVVVELRPYLDDGRHWVLMSNGVAQRVVIDRAWLAKYKLTIAPVRASATAPATAPASVRHTVLALRRTSSSSPVRITLADAASGQRRDVQWAISGGKSDPIAISDWAMARAAGWLPLTSQGHAPLLQAWLDRAGALYGASPSSGRDRFAAATGMMPGREPRTTSVFDLLGGRAALRETLQLELLRTAAAPPFGAAAASVSIDSLKGVDVRGMPFETMLKGRPPASLALADRVPDDRLFVYFAKPSAVFPFLGQGADFLARTGGTLTATAFDDNLKARYLRRLGLPEESSRRFLESGAVSELALVASDLFFIEGTDVTLLMRMRAPDAAAAGLKLLAGIDLPASGIVERRAPGSSRPAFWARHGDVVYLGTNRRDVERMLTLAANPAGSLGRSAELRYMLSEVPVTADTRAVVYLSDPFIRRMVGPAVKIGQLRRMRAAAEMTLITAGAMLRTLDGHREPTDVATLVNLGYVPRSIAAAEYVLQPDSSVVSRTWGTLADLNAVDVQAIRTVTQDEAEAYTAYMEEYREYWRQFFDPIVMRLDDEADGGLELTTFILPLVDSQLYSQLQGVIESAETGAPLKVPVLSPAPVMQLSVNLSDDSWVGLSSSWSEFFSQYTGLSAEIFDLMGPGLHIAVQDADPVISLGASDLLGAFGGATMGARFDMMMPLALSMLTRPARILIELDDAPRALTLMRRAARTGAGPARGLPVMFRQIEGRDAWMYTLGVPGIAVVRLGLEIQNGYLVITNSPWSTGHAITRVDTRPLNGAAVQVTPESVRLGLAALFATQAEHDQTAALSSIGSLLPMLLTGSPTPDAAASRHASLFGAAPMHPGAGTWLWQNGVLESSRYGSATRWKVPAFSSDAGDFGVLSGTTAVDLNMRFESGGLRAVARWKVK